MVSYGYDRKKGEKIQTINEKEAVIVKEIFEMFLTDCISYHKIAKSLNARNISTKGNSDWHVSTVKLLLTNCNYKGYVRYATKDKKRNFEVKGHHEPIIEEEIFDKVQELIKKTSKKVYKKHPKTNHYFAGLVFCGICGQKMVAHGDYKKDENSEYTSPATYRCPNRCLGKCTASNARHSKIEKEFIQYINEYDDFNTLDEIQLAMKAEIKVMNLDLIKEIKRQLAKLERREKEAVQSYIKEVVDMEGFNLIKSTIDSEKKELLSQMERIEGYVDEEITIKKENIIKNLKENWERLKDEEKRQFLINFVDRIDVINEKEKGKREGIVKVTNVEFSLSA